MADPVDTPLDKTPNAAAPIDVFEVGFRIFGNELLAMSVSSQSKAKNWAFFGIITLIALTVLVANLGPELVSLVSQMQAAGISAQK